MVVNCVVGDCTTLLMLVIMGLLFFAFRLVVMKIRTKQREKLKS